MLSGVFLLLSMVFVWRSFYGMRIPVEAASHASATKAVRP